MPSQAELNPVADRRRAERAAVYKSAHIFLLDAGAVKCFVHNLSETGAKIEVHTPLPAIFDLMFDDDQSHRRCHVVWRRGIMVGVRFQ